MTTSARPRLFDLLDGSQPCTEDPELFFQHEGDDHEPAKAVCRACPLVRDCLAYALPRDVKGVWGATTTDERKALRRRHGIPVERLQISDYLVNVFARPPRFAFDDDLED